MWYGFLSDGASRVADLCPEAWFCHDMLIKLPWVERDGLLVRLNRFQVDLVYGSLLLRWKRPYFAVERTAALMFVNCFPFGPWARYRKQEREMGAEEWRTHVRSTFVLQPVGCWALPTIHTRDAIWIC
jgi:hypothetical protein